MHVIDLCGAWAPQQRVVESSISKRRHPGLTDKTALPQIDGSSLRSLLTVLTFCHEGGRIDVQMALA